MSRAQRKIISVIAEGLLHSCTIKSSPGFSFLCKCRGTRTSPKWFHSAGSSWGCGAASGPWMKLSSVVAGSNSRPAGSLCLSSAEVTVWTDTVIVWPADSSASALLPICQGHCGPSCALHAGMDHIIFLKGDEGVEGIWAQNFANRAQGGCAETEAQVPWSRDSYVEQPQPGQMLGRLRR